MAKFKQLKSKNLSLPQLNKRRFVLSVGDEGAILTYMDGSRVLRRLFAFAPNPQEIVPFRELLSSDTKSPVFVLLDVMDQSYVPQSLPPVSSLGLHKLVEKRLARDFAAEDIKGALPLGRSEDGRKDWHFLFISVPNIPPTSGWIEFLTGLDNRVRGIYLLPIESRGFINDLHAAIFGKASGERKSAEWQILVSHNKVGGFRQVVLRNGKLVFTRLTQPIGEAVPGVIAGNIEQEVSNTLEYLKRLSFSDGATLDIYLIVADAIKEALANGSLQKYHVYAFSPHEVAGMLGLSGAAEPGDSFGDVVIAAVFGRTLRKRLVLQTPYTEKLNQLHTLADWSRMAVTALVPIMLIMYVIMSVGIYSFSEEIDTFTAQKKRADILMAEARKKADSLPEDIDRVTDAVDLYEMLSQGENTPLDTVNAFRQAMNDDVRVKSMDWKVGDFIKIKEGTVPQLTAIFEIEFTKEWSLEEFHKNATEFFDRLRKQFPDYEVTHSKLPGTIGENEDLEVNFDETQALPQKIAQGEVTITVTIAGPKEAGSDVKSGKDKKKDKNKKKVKGKA